MGRGKWQRKYNACMRIAEAQRGTAEGAVATAKAQEIAKKHLSGGDDLAGMLAGAYTRAARNAQKIREQQKCKERKQKEAKKKERAIRARVDREAARAWKSRGLSPKRMMADRRRGSDNSGEGIPDGLW